jgi:inosose dehydratase
MRSLGLRATEAGPDGYLPEDGAALARLLEELELRLVGGFVPVVLHERTALAGALERARRAVERFAEAGGSVFCSAVVTDYGWSPPPPLSRDDWRRVFDGFARLDEIAAERGVRHALHPHAGTLVESAADVSRVLEACDVAFCLDTGHLTIGGFDPVELARDASSRVAHVHLKDVRETVAARARTGRLTLTEATREGLFRPLGEGDVAVADVVLALEGAGYEGWYVLEQDTILENGESPAAAGPREDVQKSIAYLQALDSGRVRLTQAAEGR